MFVYCLYVPYLCTLTARGRAAVARRAHNPKVTGSIPVLATKNRKPLKGAFFVMTYTVYILYSNLHDTIYIGHTSNLINRFLSHNKLGKDWTKRYRPWMVIFCEYFENKADAAKREKELKSGQGRQWIWKCIREQLPVYGYIFM